MENIVTIKFGSHLYGTSTPNSDLDYKSVHIPDGKSIILGHVKDSITKGKKTKVEYEKNTKDDIDDESYTLQRYLELLIQGQTVCIDMLFAPDSHYFTTHPKGTNLWDHIFKNKDKLLTKKSAAFVGYCRTQANKYGIKGSRVAAAKKAADLFIVALKDLGPLAKVREVSEQLKVITDDHTQLVQLPIGPKDSRLEWYFECCNRKVCFTNTIKEAAKIYTRIYDEYGKRAKLAQDNDGIDWKALSHAVRVGHEALELLNTGFVTFPLYNKEFVLDIKLGRISYDIVAKEIEALLDEVENASFHSKLREEVDQDFIDNLVYETYLKAVLTS